MAIEQTANTDRLACFRLSALPVFTAYTICGWFKWLSAPNTYQAPFGLNNATANYHMPYVTTADAILRSQAMVSNTFTDAIVRTLAFNVWYFIAARGNPTSLTTSVVVAGETSVTSNTSAAGPPAGSPAELSVLGSAWSSQYWLGRAAHLKVYDAILSDAELLAEMAYAPVRTANLNGYYPFATVATAATDASGNGRTLTMATTSMTLADTADVPPVVTGAVAGAPPPFATFSRPRVYARARRG